MAQEAQSFRSSVLGFDRNDVINYIEAMTKEHHEEVEAFRSAAEVLRRERDEARRELENRDSQIVSLKEDTSELDNLKVVLEKRDAEVAELEERLRAATETLNKLQEEAAGLRAQNEDIQKQSEMIGKAKQRVADMELMAYKRAQEIENEALQNAERARVTLQRLVRDTKGKYSAAKGEVESVAYGVLSEITRMRDWFDDFPRLFDDIDDLLDSVTPRDGKTSSTAQSFAPESFDTQTQTRTVEDTPSMRHPPVSTSGMSAIDGREDAATESCAPESGGGMSGATEPV